MAPRTGMGNPRDKGQTIEGVLSHRFPLTPPPLPKVEGVPRVTRSLARTGAHPNGVALSSADVAFLFSVAAEHKTKACAAFAICALLFNSDCKGRFASKKALYDWGMAPRPGRHQTGS